MDQLKKGFIFLYFGLTLLTTVDSQTCNYRQYTEKDGLANIIVYSSFQDSKGNIWFGTFGGLNCFDGFKFKKLTMADGLLSNFVITISEDLEGKIWIGTPSGVNCYFKDRIKQFTSRNGLPGNDVRAIICDTTGTIWIATTNGLSSFKGKVFKNFTTANGLPSNLIYRLAIDDTGSLWVGTDNGLSRMAKNQFKNYTVRDGLINNTVLGLFNDDKGRLWIGTKNGVSCFYDGKFISSYTSQNGLCNDVVNAIFIDLNGNIYFGTTCGISILSEGKFINSSLPKCLLNNDITSIMTDREKNIWITSDTGVTFLRGDNVLTFSETNGLFNNVVHFIISDKKNNIWIGSEGGVNCFSKGIFTAYTQKNGLINNKVNQLLEDQNGNIWIGTFDGLSLLNNGRFSNFTVKDGLSGNLILGLSEDKNGTIWIGTDNGINCFKNGQVTHPPFDIEPQYMGNILVDSKENLWFASLSGVYNYSPSQNRLRQYTINDGLPHNHAINFYEDKKGKIWICTYRGLACYNKNQFTNYSSKNLLADKVCAFVMEDRQGNLWIGTTEGLSCFDGKNSFKTYTAKRNGLISDNWNCGMRDHRGALWFGSPYGINTFTPPFQTNLVPPPVHITAVKVIGEEVPVSQYRQFEHNFNNFRFDFTGICFTTPESVTYQYQLAGMDTRWMDTDEPFIFYPYLPPGDYTFRVKAFNNDGIESMKPAEFSFTIKLPWWKTGWFYSLVFILVLSVIFILVRMYILWEENKRELKDRTRQLMMSQRMELMSMLAAGAVHDMQNLLTIIIGYSSIINRNTAIDDQSRQLLVSIKDAANSAVHLVKQILTFSRQKTIHTTSTVDLVPELNEILELLKIIIPDEIQLVWNPPSEKILFVINPIQLQQIVMNLCINAVQAMPEGGVLTLTLSKEGNHWIVLEISDNGCGMEQEVQDQIFEPLFTTRQEGKGTGLGLFVVQQLVKEYDGVITVRSIPGNGTCFSIRFKT